MTSEPRRHRKFPIARRALAAPPAKRKSVQGTVLPAFVASAQSPTGFRVR